MTIETQTRWLCRPSTRRSVVGIVCFLAVLLAVGSAGMSLWVTFGVVLPVTLYVLLIFRLSSRDGLVVNGISLLAKKPLAITRSRRDSIRTEAISPRELDELSKRVRAAFATTGGIVLIAITIGFLAN